MSARQSVRCNEPTELAALVQADASEGTLASVLEAVLQSLARRFEANPAGCTGLQQETLILLWLSTDSTGPRVSLQTWLYSVAEGVFVPHLIARLAGRTLPNRRREDTLNPASCSPDPDAALASRARVTLLLALLGSFRPREREAALLDLQQFEPDQIAKNLRCSVGQARQLLALGQRRLELWFRQSQISLDSPPVSVIRVSGE